MSAHTLITKHYTDSFANWKNKGSWYMLDSHWNVLLHTITPPWGYSVLLICLDSPWGPCLLQVLEALVVPVVLEVPALLVCHLLLEFLSHQGYPVYQEVQSAPVSHGVPVKHTTRLVNIAKVLDTFMRQLPGLWLVFLNISAAFNPLKTKRRPLYLKTQSVPHCKHFSSRL